MELEDLGRESSAPLRGSSKNPSKVLLEEKSINHGNESSLDFPPELSLEAVVSENFAGFRRLITNLLPIRYPDNVFKNLLANPRSDSISRAAVWQWPAPSVVNATRKGATAEPHVVGAICCRVEPPMDVQSNAIEHTKLYIQMLAVLSAFREKGIATALLRDVVRQGLDEHRVATVYAHVWEANVEALDWYKRRGFSIDETVPGYYRKLSPSGAKVVRWEVGQARADHSP